MTVDMRSLPGGYSVEAGHSLFFDLLSPDEPQQLDQREFRLTGYRPVAERTDCTDRIRRWCRQHLGYQ